MAPRSKLRSTCRWCLDHCMVLQQPCRHVSSDRRAWRVASRALGACYCWSRGRAGPLSVLCRPLAADTRSSGCDTRRVNRRPYVYQLLLDKPTLNVTDEKITTNRYFFGWNKICCKIVFTEKWVNRIVASSRNAVNNVSHVTGYRGHSGMRLDALSNAVALASDSCHNPAPFRLILTSFQIFVVRCTLNHLLTLRIDCNTNASGLQYNVTE